MSRLGSGLVAVAAAGPALVLTDQALAATITGTPGDDRLVGTPRADTISGLAGNDEIRAGRGAVFCGPGHDRVWRGARLDPRDRFHDCEEFSDHP